MKIHLHYHDSNETHTRITVFIDGANCGELCLNTKDIVTFQLIICAGCVLKMDHFISTGRIWDDDRLTPREEGGVS